MAHNQESNNNLIGGQQLLLSSKKRIRSLLPKLSPINRNFRFFGQRIYRSLLSYLKTYHQTMTTMLMSNTVLLEPALFYESSADSKEFIHSLSSQMEPIMNFDTMNNVSHEGLAQFDHIVNNGDPSCNNNLVDDFVMDFDCSNWSLKPPEQWQPHEVSDWIRTWAQHNGVQDIDVAHLLYNPMAGFELCQLRRDYFTSVCPQFGNMIFDSLQALINQYRSNTLMSSQDFNFPAIPNFDLLSGNICLDLDSHVGHSPSSASESDRESTSSNLSAVNERKPIQVNSYFPAILTTNSSNVSNLMPETRALLDQKPSTALPVAVKKAGRRGRPPKKDAKSRSKGNGKLWEFIRDLLLNSITNPSLIRWERREDGIFKFVQSDKVAKMWGERKQNPRMTYEKLSRAMRYYYKSQVLLPVFGRRLVYKFGPNATGWRPQYDHISMKQQNGLHN